MLPNPRETCQAVFDFVSALGGGVTFHHPVSLFPSPVRFDGPLQEYLVPVRYLVPLQRIVTSRYKKKARERRALDHANN